MESLVVKYRKGGMYMQAFYWLIIFVIALIVEIATMGLMSIWFAGGALIAWVFAKIGFGTTVQVVVFIIASLLLLILTRPIAVKFFNVQRQKTNAESLIGECAVVIEEVDTIKAQGRVEIHGMEWSAKTDEPDGKIAAGKIVVVDGIQGVKLIVRDKEVRLC